MEWITSLYSRNFTRVPLVINYHRHIGAPVSEGRQVDPDSEHLLQIAIDNGYCLRADSFGMHNQDWGYNDWERNYVKQWNQKYKVAYALLDMQTEKPVYQFVDESTDLSTWLKGSPASYDFDISMKKVAIGGYIWAVGLVDTTLDDGEGIHPIGIQVAVEKDSLTEDGWVKLANVTVN